ncbi:MAG: retropepsin-like aspartic protease [Steroidobacteraceae bacterium]
MNPTPRLTRTGIWALTLLCPVAGAVTQVEIPAGTVPEPPLPEVTIAAPEPRWVAPTRRDRIGRIWAPVMLDGKGPYRLVLDTGANRSVIVDRVAAELGDAVKTDRKIRVLGVTGSAVVPVVRVGSMEIGDLMLAPVNLPIVPDVFGGADGILGNEGLRDKRIVIDFKRDLITVRFSKRERPGPGFQTLRIAFRHNHLITFDVMVGRVRARAILDTGARRRSATPRCSTRCAAT